MRAMRAEDIDPDDVDWEWDKEHPHEPDSVTRATASDWQLKEAMRLAEEFAFLRPGTQPHEISKGTLRRVRQVQRAWCGALEGAPCAPASEAPAKRSGKPHSGFPSTEGEVPVDHLVHLGAHFAELPRLSGFSARRRQAAPALSAPY